MDSQLCILELAGGRGREQSHLPIIPVKWKAQDVGVPVMGRSVEDGHRGGRGSSRERRHWLQMAPMRRGYPSSSEHIPRCHVP